MFHKRSLNPMEVDRLMAQGKNQAEVGRILGFTRQAVCSHLKARENKSLTNPEQFKGLGPLAAVIRTTLGELKYLNNEIKSAEKATDRERLNGQRLKYLAEARKDFELALKIDEKRFKIDEVIRFKNFVIETIGEVDEDTRTKIIGALRQRHALERSLK